ncbi:hypothetical protein Hanom_Chr12g01167661 [Helianthus anomalus]
MHYIYRQNKIQKARNKISFLFLPTKCVTVFHKFQVLQKHHVNQTNQKENS